MTRNTDGGETLLNIHRAVKAMVTWCWDAFGEVEVTAIAFSGGEVLGAEAFSDELLTILAEEIESELEADRRIAADAAAELAYEARRAA